MPDMSALAGMMGGMGGGGMGGGPAAEVTETEDEDVDLSAFADPALLVKLQDNEQVGALAVKIELVLTGFQVQKMKSDPEMAAFFDDLEKDGVDGVKK
jgi:hypothetical protein